MSWLIMVDSKIIYVHTSNEMNNDKFQELLNEVVPLLMKLYDYSK
jgi:hypothetical protein